MEKPSSSRPLVELDRVSLTRNGRTLLADVSWSLAPGERWLVLGDNGAGKTSLLSLARGDVWPDRDGLGQRLYCVEGQVEASPLAFRRISGLCSVELLRLFRRHRLNLSVRELLAGGFSDSLRQHRELRQSQLDTLQRVAAELGLTSLLERRLLELSNGQAQTALLARSLVKDPVVLFVDEIGDSLDAGARQRLHAAVLDRDSRLQSVVWATHRPEGAFAHHAQILRLVSGRRAARPPQDGDGNPQDQAGGPEASSPTAQPIVGDLLRFRSVQRHSGTLPPREAPEPVLVLEQADVVRKGRLVLRRVDWTICRGEHWLVSGANGSGKSTLLKLLLGELHPSPGGKVHRWTGPRASLEEIKQRIGHFAPDIEAEHSRPQSGLETVLSGLFGHIGLNRKVEAAQEALARRMLQAFGLSGLADRDIRTLSCGERRMLLLLRAVINGPELLLADEPCAGLDPASRLRVADLLQGLAEQGTQLILVAHRQEDLPTCLDKQLLLKDGAVQWAGRLAGPAASTA